MVPECHDSENRRIVNDSSTLLTNRPPAPAERHLSRRQFLQRGAALGLSGAGFTIAGCGFPAALVGTPPPRKVPRVGLFVPGQTEEGISIQTFRQGLSELGYVEGQNIILERRINLLQDKNLEEARAAAAELVALKVDVIVALFAPRGGLFTLAEFSEMAGSIPIVFSGLSDPTVTGVIASQARPGGNLTGIVSGSGGSQGDAKRLELLKETVPQTTRVAQLRLSLAGSPNLLGLRSAARTLGVELEVFDVARVEELERAFDAAAEWGADAVMPFVAPIFGADPLRRVVDLVAKRRLPAMYPDTGYVTYGGLMAFSVSGADTFRRAAVYVDKILRGAKAGDLPIELPTKFELAVNLKTAAALGLTFPDSILIQATEVIR